jgi:hypothetical protein
LNQPLTYMAWDILVEIDTKRQKDAKSIPNELNVSNY